MIYIYIYVDTYIHTYIHIHTQYAPHTYTDKYMYTRPHMHTTFGGLIGELDASLQDGGGKDLGGHRGEPQAEVVVELDGLVGLE